MGLTMAKNEGFYGIITQYRQAIKEIRKQIDSAEHINELIAETFVTRARARLSLNNNAKNQAVISKLLGNIYSRKTKNGVQIVIRQDPEGLMTYLEYGTGLLGEAYAHPEASEFGWNYRQNDYYENPAYKSVNGRRGWFFRTFSPNIYIDNNDSDRREGGSLVFSQGIKPVRYIYDTRIEIEDLIVKADGDFVYLEQLLKRLKPVI